jgi:trigger factor
LKASVAQPQSWKRVLDIEVPAEEVEQAFTAKLSTFRKKVKLPGFRQGKVPDDVLRTRFGEAIRAETIEDLVQRCYEDACSEKGIVPISQAKVNDLKAEEGNPLSFTVETEVEPDIEIKGYEKLKIRVAPAKVRPADVDRMVLEIRQGHATYSEVEREARKGDFVQVEYQKVIIDGEERADVNSPQYPVELGTSSIKGFDKALIGRSKDDITEASIVFPKDYGDPEIANKKAQFTIKVAKVQERTLPPVDEELLKKLGDFKNEDALRERINADLEEREKQRARNEAAAKAIESLIKTNPFEIPPSRIDRYIDQMFEEATKRVREGEPVPTREELDARYRTVGINAMKRYRIIDYIANKENIKASQKDVDEQIQQIATQYGQPFDSVKDALRRNGTTNRIREDIRERKTLDYLIGEYDPKAESAS